jgi:tetratricopeptide (TPR) repeat protein
VSLLPGTILKFVELLGFEGDRRAALALLTRSFDANHFTSPFSCLMLLMHHVVIALFTGEQNEESLANAQRLLDWARQRYPSGVAFLYFQARFHRCRGELDLATRVSDRALQECRDMKLGRGWLFTFLFQRGWCSYLLTRWDETTEFFAPLLQSPVFHSEKSRPSMRAFHAYHIGLCHVMLGQRDRARQSFETVALHVSDIKNPRRIESFALRKARHFLAADGHVCPPLEVAELCIMWEGFAQMDARTRALHAALLDKACAFYGVRVEGEPLRFDGDNEQAARAGEPAEHPVWATWTSAGSFKPFHALRLYLTRAFLAYANGQEALAVWCLEHVLRSVEAADKVTVKHAHEDGVVPLAAFLRGQIYYSNGDFAHAKEMHRKASSFSDFDLYQNIQFRLHAFGQLIDAALAKRS